MNSYSLCCKRVMLLCQDYSGRFTLVNLVALSPSIMSFMMLLWFSTPSGNILALFFIYLKKCNRKTIHKKSCIKSSLILQKWLFLCSV